ncbi:MAG: hypothetical protein ACK4QW_03435 [Alphaproteobacteria bacterium]
MVPADPTRRHSPRMITGAIAGLVATFAMTVAMRQLHRLLPHRERYPLPPRELTERLTPTAPRDGGADHDVDSGPQQTAMVAHFAYGAATGAFLPLIRARPTMSEGSAYGVFVWAASYLGWIPLVGALRPATEHPGRRNLLMIAAHLVWGSALVIAHRELVRAEMEAFAAGPHDDAHVDGCVDGGGDARGDGGGGNAR